ncbi:7826_t:CDS:2, partial [Cetraspora pellucida]
IDCTTTILEVEEASPNLEVEITSPTLEIKETLSTLEVNITSPSLTSVKFAFFVFVCQYIKITSPIYTYQPSEVTSFNSAQQHINVTSLSTYQYNLKKGDSFDDWSSDPNDSNITRHKSFHCSSSGTYNSWKNIDQNLHHLHVKPGYIVHLNARYQQLSNEMIEDLRILTEYIYNVIYCLCEYYKDEKPDSGLFLESLFEKMLFTETLSSSKATFTLKSLQQFQKLEHNEAIHYATSLRNWFGIAFSVSKTAINIALETNSDEELIQMLKNFIM